MVDTGYGSLKVYGLYIKTITSLKWTLELLVTCEI